MLLEENFLFLKKFGALTYGSLVYISGPFSGWGFSPEKFSGKTPPGPKFYPLNRGDFVPQSPEISSQGAC